MNKVEARLQSLDPAVLTAIVRQALQDGTAAVLDWSYQPLDGGFSGSAVYRIQGRAQTSHGTQPWSLILKVISSATGGQAPSDFDYWKREALLYQSGLLADLPVDLVAPRCFEIVEFPDQSCWLWLQDMGVADDDEWPLAHYGIAARHLGQMNGAYLVGRTLPQAEWLRTPDVRQRLALAEPGIAELPQLRHHPQLAEHLAGDQVERITRLWEERNRFLTLLERLPPTFCHRDAFRRNLIMQQDAAGRAQTILLDWGAAGLGTLGEELVPLFAATLSFVAVEIEHIPAMEQIIFAGYLAGLRDVGWQGDERLVRFGFTALTALKAGVADPAIKLPGVARRIAALPPDAEPPRFLSPGGVPQAVAKRRYLLDLGEEAHTLLGELTMYQ